MGQRGSDLGLHVLGRCHRHRQPIGLLLKKEEEGHHIYGEPSMASMTNTSKPHDEELFEKVRTHIDQDHP